MVRYKFTIFWENKIPVLKTSRPWKAVIFQFLQSLATSLFYKSVQLEILCLINVNNKFATD
jgi:hypothetical protein